VEEVVNEGTTAGGAGALEHADEPSRRGDVVVVERKWDRSKEGGSRRSSRRTSEPSPYGERRHQNRPSTSQEQQQRRSKRARSRERISLGEMAEARAADRLPFMASATDAEVRWDHAATPPATRCRESEGND
jgi:hypothetical protein